MLWHHGIAPFVTAIAAVAYAVIHTTGQNDVLFGCISCRLMLAVEPSVMAGRSARFVASVLAIAVVIIDPMVRHFLAAVQALEIAAGVRNIPFHVFHQHASDAYSVVLLAGRVLTLLVAVLVCVVEQVHGEVGLLVRLETVVEILAADVLGRKLLAQFVDGQRLVAQVRDADCDDRYAGHEKPPLAQEAPQCRMEHHPSSWVKAVPFYCYLY